MKLIRKLKNLKGEPPLLVFQTALDKLTLNRIQVRRFYLLQHPSRPDVTRTRGPGKVRKADLPDVDEMAGLEDAAKKQFFADRFLTGDHCVVAVVDEKIVGYEWFSTKAQHVEERYRYAIPIPDDTIYAYDGFIITECRLLGIWIRFQKYLAELMRQQGRSRIITLIDSDNIHSLNTHVKFGFIIFKKIVLVRIGSKRFFIERNISASPGQQMKAGTGNI
jgi:hypothetical protein